MHHTTTHKDIPNFLRFYFPELQIRDGPLEARVNCPAHDEMNPSCSVNLTSGLWYCHTCEAKGDLIDFYRQLHNIDFGTALNELNKKQWRNAHMELNKTKAIAIIHPYLDDHGGTAFEVLRELDTQGHTIRITQRRPDGSGGYIHNLEGVTKTIYRRDEVANAKEVMIAEGEKDVDRLRRHGFTATCNPGGAGKWRDEYSAHLKGKRVAIFEDNDIAGKKHAQMVAQSLAGIAQEVRVISFDELPLKSDVSDWLDKGHTKEELIERIERTSLWTPPIEAPLTAKVDWDFITGGQLFDIEFKHTFLIEGLLGEKESLLIAGGSGIGKSLMTNDMALTAGANDNRILWGRFPIPSQMKTLFIQAENTDHAVQDRLKTMCAGNPSLEAAARNNIILPKVGGTCRIQGSLADTEFILNITKIVKASGVKLVIIDPLISFAGVDENDNTRMREVLNKLDRLMDETNTSVIVIHHMAKNKPKSVQGGRGAQAISDWAANIIQLETEKGHEDGSRLILHHQKTRNFTPKTPKFTLQRTANLLYMPAGDIVNEAERAKAKSVVDKLADLGGSIDKQRSFVDALVADSTASSETVAQTMITDAVKAGHIVVVPGPGKAKGYRLPENTTIEQEPKLANAA